MPACEWTLEVDRVDPASGATTVASYAHGAGGASARLCCEPLQLPTVGTEGEALLFRVRLRGPPELELSLTAIAPAPATTLSARHARAPGAAAPGPGASADPWRALGLASTSFGGVAALPPLVATSGAARLPRVLLCQITAPAAPAENAAASAGGPLCAMLELDAVAAASLAGCLELYLTPAASLHAQRLRAAPSAGGAGVEAFDIANNAECKVRAACCACL